MCDPQSNTQQQLDFSFPVNFPYLSSIQPLNIRKRKPNKVRMIDPFISSIELIFEMIC